MSGKMEAVTLLLIILTVPGYSYVLQPRLMLTQIGGLDRDHLSETSEQLRDVSVSVTEKERSEPTERRKIAEEHRTEGLTTDTHPERMAEKITAGFTRNIGESFHAKKEYEKGSKERQSPQTFSKILGEEIKKEEFSIADMMKYLDDKRDKVQGEEETNEESKAVKDILTDNSKTWEAQKQGTGMDDETLEKFEKNDEMEKLGEEIEEEKKESKLVAGISPHQETRGGAHEGKEKASSANQENVEGKRGNEEQEERGKEVETIKTAKHNVEREDEDHIVVSNLTPHLSTTPLGGEFMIPPTIQIITQSSNPPSSHHHNVPPSLPVTPTQVPPVSTHPSVPQSSVSHRSDAATLNHMSVPTVGSVLLLTAVLQSPGHHLKQNKLEGKASQNLEDVIVENTLLKPAQKKEFIPKVQATTARHTNEKFITKDLKTKETNSTSKSNENNPTAKLVELLLKTNTAQRTDKPKASEYKSNPQSKLARPSATMQPTTAKTPSRKKDKDKSKTNRSSKNKKMNKLKENKRKKDNRTQKIKEKKKVITPTHFPYFMDDYCPPECACYGSVVQCSDKGVDKVPYGIPYNARYILLMNNYIDSIQLDLLNEYVSLEFLVLSNNQLTNGAIEGAFEEIPALKRLYLDRNLLESVPTDLPVSLEELRLDNNQLSVMSDAAWVRCPGLLVLSLSNNSLGNGSDSLPNAAFSPLSNLHTLNLDHNQLKSVPLGLPLSIKELYLKGNHIEQFREGAFNGISELMVLDLSANRLTNKGLFRESLLNTTHLESLNLEGNRLKQVPRHLPPSLKTLNLEGNLISSIKKAALSILKNLEHLGLARNKIFKVAPGAFKALPVLHQLDLCHNILHQVPRELPQALHSVALTHNKIQSVPRDAFCWGNKSLSLSRLVRVQLEHNLIDMRRLDAQAFRCLRGFQVVHFY